MSFGLSEDLTGFEKWSGLVVRIRISRIREFAEWVGVYSANSKILEILILTISDFNQLTEVVYGNALGLPALSKASFNKTEERRELFRRLA